MTGREPEFGDKIRSVLGALTAWRERHAELIPLAIEAEPWQSHVLEIGTTQHVYRFPNSRGASVVQGPYTFGAEDGLWELGVIRFVRGDEWTLDYDTPVTADVIGWLAPEEVAGLLLQIAKLP